MKSFVSLLQKTRQRFASLTDRRRGKNTRFSMEDFATSAFSVFFTQSPSFLACQKTMQQNKGRSNAQSLFQIEEIPCDNQIRDCLDPVAPEEIFPLYDEALQALQECKPESHTALYKWVSLLQPESGLLCTCSSSA